MREPAPRGPVVEIDELEKRIRAGAAPASAEAPRAARPDPLTELARLMQAAQAESDPYSRIFAEPPPRSPAAQNMPAGAAPHALEPSFAPLPPLPPLPSLPKRDPLSSRGLQEPTFTPPSAPIAPAPEFDYANVNLRGSLPPNSWNDQPAPGAPRPATQAPAVDAVPDARYDASYYGEAEEDWAADEQYAQAQYAEDQYAAYEDDYDYDTGPTAPASPIDNLRRSLRPWHAIAAVSALAVISIGWGFLHRAGVGGSREIATIAAPEGPMKVKPTVEPESDTPTATAAAVLDRNEAEPVKKVVKNLEQAVDPTVAPTEMKAPDPNDAAPGELPGTVKLGGARVDAPHEPPAATPPGSLQPRKVKSVAVPAAPAIPAAATAAAPTPLPMPAAPSAAPAPAAKPTAPTPATGATYSSQFAAVNSEAEARALIKTLSGKYGGAPGGGKLTFKPVKTGDKTVYRVRVGGLTKEAAEGLCAKAKAAGDSCFSVSN